MRLPKFAFLLPLALLAFSACDKEVPTTPVPVTPVAITVSPATADAAVGDSVQLVAVVSGSSNTAAQFVSTNTAIATVSATGMVKAKTAGTVVVKAIAAADTTKVATSTITVAAQPVTPAPQVNLTIKSISQGGVPVNINNVTGQIDVTLNVEADAGVVSGVSVAVDATTVCTQTISSHSADLSVQATAQEIVCSVNTAQFNSTTGVPAFLNGAHTVSAKVTYGVSTKSVTNSTPLIFNNADKFVGAISTPKAAKDASGLVWNGGDVTVEAVPVFYSGKALVSFTVAFAGSSKTVTSGTTVVFSADSAIGGTANGVAGLRTAGAAPTITSTVGNGEAGPAAFSNAADLTIRVDNEAPDAGTLTLAAPSTNSWVNGSYKFADGKAGEADAGVGGVTVTYHAGAATLTNAQLEAIASASTSAGLSASITNAQYKVRAVVTDALGNKAAVNSPAFGVDLTAPTLVFADGSVADRAINAGGSFVTTYNDDLSGLTGTPVYVMLTREFPGRTATQACTDGGVNTYASGACVAAATNGTTAVPATAGYWTYTAYAMDKAGNRSASITRRVLVDATVPAAASLVIPPALTGGAAAVFGATATDNLDAVSAEIRQTFAGTELPFVAPATVGSAFDLGLVTSQIFTQTWSFVRSLEATDGGNAPSTVLQAATGIKVNVLDAAGNFGTASQAFAGGITAGTSASTRGVQLFSVSTPSAATNVCNGEGNCGTTAQSVTLSAVATGATSTFTNPFAAVYFFRVDGSGTTRLIGVATATSYNDDGTNRRWTYSATFAPAGLAAQANAPIFAVGVSSNGDGLQSRNNTNLSVVAGS